MPYAAALILTLAVEVPIYVAALVLGVGWPPRRAVLVAVGLNLATHPLAWLVLLRAGPSYPASFWLVECGVWLAETGLLCVLAPAPTGRLPTGRLQTGRLPQGRREVGLLALIALVANTGSALAGVGAWLLGW